MTNTNWRMTEVWSKVFSRIDQRNMNQAQSRNDSRDAMIYSTRKRLQREGLIRKGR